MDSEKISSSSSIPFPVITKRYGSIVVCSSAAILKLAIGEHGTRATGAFIQVRSKFSFRFSYGKLPPQQYQQEVQSKQVSCDITYQKCRKFNFAFTSTQIIKNALY